MNTMAKTTATPTDDTLNGVEVSQLAAISDAIRTTPELAQSQYRLSNQWINGGRSRCRISEFRSGDQTVKHRREFTLDVDMPEPLGGTDVGATPGEYLLTGLVACIATTVAYHAAVRGIEIRSLRAKVTGDLDLQGFLGLGKDVRRGFKDIQVDFFVDANEEDVETLESIIALSPMLDTVAHGTNVNVSLVRR